MNQRRPWWDDPQITIECGLQLRINTIRCQIHSVTGEERDILASELQNARATLVECIEQRHHVLSTELVRSSSGGRLPTGPHLRSTSTPRNRPDFP
jgi:hypothetical protein